MSEVDGSKILKILQKLFFRIAPHEQPVDNRQSPPPPPLVVLVTEKEDDVIDWNPVALNMSETETVEAEEMVKFEKVAVPPETLVAVVVPESVATPELTLTLTMTPAPPRFPMTGRFDDPKVEPLTIAPG